jgi:hypothetical protein
MSSPRRFPPPWSIDEGTESFIVKDANGQAVAVACAALSVPEEALRNSQVKLVLGPRHGDIEKPPFFLDFRRGAGSKVGGQTAIDGVE